MGYKPLSMIDVSDISAFTGLSNILEAKVALYNDVILVLRMDEDEDMVSIRCLSRVAEYFGVGQENVILNSNPNGMEVSIIGQENFLFNDELVEDPKPTQGCCGTGGCPGCPSARK